uniref:Uncharacterized protein n=1 Tax=Arundo donax TaxID=35708 RepID=A0A0A8Y991_ARUDO
MTLPLACAWEMVALHSSSLRQRR